MNDVVITAALRSAVGKFNGSLGKVPAVELGAQIIKALLAGSGVRPDQISEVIFGQVFTARRRAESGAAGSDPRRITGHRARDDDWQGLWKRPEGYPPGRAGDQVR